MKCSRAARWIGWVFGSILLGGCSEAGSSGALAGAAGAAGSAGSGATAGNLGSGDSGGAGAVGGSVSGGAGAGGAAAGAGGATGGTADSGGAAIGFTRPEGQVPNSAYDPSLENLAKDDWQKGLVSPTLLAGHHLNQPTILNGYLNLNGNEEFWFYDVTDPKAPIELSHYSAPNRDPKGGPKMEGEAESHCVAYGKYGEKTYEITTAGHGVDIWDVTDVRQVEHISQITLEGIAYGDFTAAVWGLSWQGNYIYVGGTDTGVHILDAHDPLNVKLVKRVPTSEFGSVSAGPLDAIGNVLVITTPKESGGIATLDISDPINPIYLDSIKPSKSYIGQFYGHYLFLQSPVRAWDVLTDPTSIGAADMPVGSLTTAGSEYMSFQDGYMFLGHLRPDGGASKIDVTDPSKMKITNRVWGRLDLGGYNDDQFTIGIGNLLVMEDDQEPYAGAVIGVHAANPDTAPPHVDSIVPKNGATGQATTSRIGISFTDNIELATVNPASFIVRPQGGEPISGTWGLRMGVLSFSPNQPLAAKTTYEVVLPKGGLTDLVQNALAEDFTSTFTTK